MIRRVATGWAAAIIPPLLYGTQARPTKPEIAITEGAQAQTE